MDDLILKNQLEQQDNGVYCVPGKAYRDFGYTDGESVEQYLDKTFSETTDLSSRSAWLQASIIDWPTEYHLSSARSSLLRGFDLPSAGNVLELGSGCGAISRYLGELGLTVDAIDGSLVRADLGRKRCRDLPNVRVINANYNDLDYPEKHYDLILFVGVIEYAGRFKPGCASNQDAVLSILSQAADSLAADGVILIAIENRLGLKYILGHHEDHYNQRYVGIHGYPEKAGIATYSHPEWESLLARAGFSEYTFTYPFPDYKVPQVLLTQSYLDNNPHAFNHLERIFSRDYTHQTRPSRAEIIAWQAASSGQFLHLVANSFCLVVAHNRSAIERTVGFDFCHAPQPARQNRHAVMTRKLRGQDRVTKTPVCREAASVDGLQQRLSEQPYLRGNLLSTEWLRAILIHDRPDEFEKWLKDYYDFLGQRQRRGQALSIDLLPLNIVVCGDGEYQVFDQEWDTRWEITRDYVLFRALWVFMIECRPYIRDFLRRLEVDTVQDFIEYGLGVIEPPLIAHMDAYVAQESHFQRLVTGSEKDALARLIRTPIAYFDEHGQAYNSRCYWSDRPGTFGESDYRVVSVVPDLEPQQVVFELPERVAALSALRLYPMDTKNTKQIGFFSLSGIELIEVGENTERTRWALHGPRMIQQHSQSKHAVFEKINDIECWLVTTDFPQLEFHFKPVVKQAQAHRFRVRVDLQVSESKAYLRAYQRYLSEKKRNDRLKKRLTLALLPQRGLGWLKKRVPLSVVQRIKGWVGR